MPSFLKNIDLGFLSRFGGSNGYVALDIGSSSVKLVETTIEKNGYRVLNLGVLPVPENSIQNNMVVDTSAIVGVIRRLTQENKVKSKRVISAVPGRAVIMKKIQMPKQEPAELEANIEFEAQNVIPDSLENVNLDHQVLHQSDESNKMDVLLVAVKKEIVNSYTDAIEGAGLVPTIMDVDYFALENIYEANYTDEVSNGRVVLIDIGAQYTSITILQSGISTFTGDLPFGGMYFTDVLSRSLGITTEEAEALKVTGLLEGKKEVDLKALLGQAAEELAEEVQRTVSLYGSGPSDDADGLKAVFLSGGGTHIVGLSAVLEERMGAAVRLGEPFRNFMMDKKAAREIQQNATTQFSIAAGLSIRRPEDK